jgi:aminodeoxyfutalosine synthase
MLTVDALRRLITEAGREPIERNTLYRRVERSPDTWRAGEAIAAAV